MKIQAKVQICNGAVRLLIEAQPVNFSEGFATVINDKLAHILDVGNVQDGQVIDLVLSSGNQAWLGHATTAELLNELQVRAEIHGYANYKTTDSANEPA